MRNQQSNTDLEEKQNIYSNIAQFLQEKFQVPSEICLRAAYLLGDDLDAYPMSENAPSDEAYNLAESAKKIIIKIKAHYELLEERGMSNRTLEIFSINPPHENLLVTRIETERTWEQIPSILHEEFIRNGKRKLSYEIYS